MNQNFTKETNELYSALLNNQFEKTKRISQKTIQLFLTEKCDLNCGFCFRRNKGFQIPDMSLNFAKKIIQQHLSPDAKISFTGGEPSLNPNLEELLKFCQEIGMDAEIYTNGLHHFNNFSTKVKLRYDGFNEGFKPMINKLYHGPYELGLLINGKNTLELIKCVLATKEDPNFQKVIQITEVVGDMGLPCCGIETYAKETKTIAEYVSKNCPWVSTIEVSVGCLGVDTGVIKCRFKRYFENEFAGTCPHNKKASDCTNCLFQKEIFIRNNV